MYNKQPRIAVVTRETRLQGLLRRWATRGQAKFIHRRARGLQAQQLGYGVDVIDAEEAEADADFDALEQEDRSYTQSVRELVRTLDFGMPVQSVDWTLLPNFDFDLCAAVVVIGQDGLVANTAKYAHDVPIVGVNPDPARFDGVLLPWVLGEARQAVSRALAGRAAIRDVTLAQATLHDGQTLLAFNDFYIGAASHVSARYHLQVGGKEEQQSSSGILVSTGAGSTGWMSSVLNMAAGVARYLGVKQPKRNRLHLDWSDRRLLWAVREPFVSRTSQANLVMGTIDEGEEMLVESMMPSAGVIFSDGVESDYLEFNGGSLARLGVARQKARLES